MRTINPDIFVVLGSKPYPKSITKCLISLRTWNVKDQIIPIQINLPKKEEQKNHDEVKKILDNKINITSTCVRIPVLVSHSISVNVEFNKKHNLEEVKTVLSSSPGCKVVDEHKDGGYITPVEAEDKFETFVSRIRDDSSQPNSINLWIVSDNLLICASINSCEIDEKIINSK